MNDFVIGLIKGYDGLVRDLLKDYFNDVLNYFDGHVKDFEKEFLIDYYEIMTHS